MKIVVMLLVLALAWGSQGNQQETCFKVKRGLYNLRTDFDSMSVCVKKESEALAPLRRLRCAADLRKSLIAHWKMDDELRYGVVDDSGNEQHGRATADVLSKWGKFSRGRLFNANMGNIVIPNSPIINVGKSSFSFAGWVKTTDITYPMTNFAVLKGYGCYREAGNAKWVPGWDIGHMYRSTSTNVCIRDHLNNKVRKFIHHDSGMQPSDLKGKWAHYAFVFDREENKIKLYINGKKQADEVDISSIKGNLDNTSNLRLGSLYGWNTKGTLDEYRFYKKALTDDEVTMIHADHKV